MQRHRSFKLDKFVKAVDDKLLKAYFKKQDLTVPESLVLNADKINEILDNIEGEDKRLDIEEEMHRINDIADNSRPYLQDVVSTLAIETNDNDTAETVAMKVRLHSEEAFLLAYDYYRYTIYDKLSHHQFKEGKYNSDKITDFKKEVEQYFKGCNKGEYCIIRERTAEDRNIIFIARGDFTKTHQVFEKDRIKTQSFRPAKEDMLVFNKKNSVLSLTTSIKGDEEKRKYIEMFGKSILGLAEIPESVFNNALVSLEPIKNKTFNYSGNEYVEWVKLTEVRVKQQGAGPFRLTIGAPDITKLFDRFHLGSEGTEFISARLKFAVRREGKKSKKIGVEIKPPETARLKERNEKKIIGDYLKENGVFLV